MVREVAKLEKFSDVVRSLIFLNSVGGYDLTTLWFYNQEYECSAYLIDYHRPLCHMNLIDPLSKIFVLDDGCRSFLECPTEDDLRIYQELHEAQSDSENNDEESEDEDNEMLSDQDSLIQENRNENQEELKAEVENLKDSDDEEGYRPPGTNNNDEEEGENIEDNIDNV